MLSSHAALPRPAALLGVLLILALGLAGCRAPTRGDELGGAPQAFGARPGVLDPDELPPALEEAGAAEVAVEDPAVEEAPVDPAPAPPPPDAAQPADEEAVSDPPPDQATTPAAAQPPPPPAAPPPPAEQPQPRDFRVVGTLSDRRGDQGLEGPDYADIIAVTIEDDGAGIRVTLDVAADIPPQLRDGEVMGVGVDLWRDPSQPESDYQLFASGGEDGWLAYLHTPRGFVNYPGEFRLGGRRLVFEVPWEHLGGLPSGGFRAFVDWSQRRLAINAFSRDWAPDRGTAPFSR